MGTQFDSLLQLSAQVLSKVAPFALSFADDALLFVITKLGITLPGMAWLPSLLLTATIVYWTVRIAIFLYSRYKAILCCG